MRDFKFTKSKKIYRAAFNHKYSINYGLTDCYKKPSNNKCAAFVECQHIMNRYDGFELKITSYNSFSFSVGFFGYIKGKLHFFWVTPDHIRAINIYDLD